MPPAAPTSPAAQPPETPQPPDAPRPPDAPANLRISAAGEDFVQWRWNAVAGATGYEVQFGRDADFTDADEIVDISGQTDYRKDSLPPGTRVYLRVRAYAGAGNQRLWSLWTLPVAAMTLAPSPPDAPSSLRVAATGGDFIEWTWDVVEGAAGYEVQYSNDEHFTEDDPTVDTGTAVRYRREALDYETRGHLRVRAYAGSDSTRIRSDWTEPASGMTRPVPVKASFAGSDLQLTEGETREVVVRYAVTELAEPVRLEVSVLSGTASEDDFRFETDTVRLPAGQTTSGDVALPLTAVPDLLFAEGDETLTIRLVPPYGAETPHAILGSELEVTIAEAGVRPCTGTVIRGAPAEGRALGQGDSAAVTRLWIEFGAGSDAVLFEWIGPYDGDEAPVDFRRQAMGRTSGLQVVMLDWTTERRAGVVEHAMGFAWPAGVIPGLETGIRFRSDDDACAGEPTAICTETGCEFTP